MLPNSGGRRYCCCRGSAPQPAAQFGHFGVNFVELLLVTNQRGLESSTIDLGHELDYKLRNSLESTLLWKLCDFPHEAHK